MCRNIKPLFNFDPPAREDEVRTAAEQFVRKISGFQKPSHANEAAFNHAVEHIMETTSELLGELTTNAPHRNREEEARKAHERAVKRFGIR
jgi:hypothetical protein